MTNVFVGPEPIEKVLTSIYKVPLKHKFRSVKDIEVREDQRLFIAIRGKEVKEEDKTFTKLLDSIPKRCRGFNEIYRLVYNVIALNNLLQTSEKPTLEDIVTSIGINTYRFDHDENKWVFMPFEHFENRKFYREDTQLSQIERLFHMLFPRKHEDFVQ